MHAEQFRELAKDICALIILRLDADLDMIPAAAISVDLLRLYSWLCDAKANGVVLHDEGVLAAAMGYNNFCTEVVSETSKCLTHCVESGCVARRKLK